MTLNSLYFPLNRTQRIPWGVLAFLAAVLFLILAIISLRPFSPAGDSVSNASRETSTFQRTAQQPPGISPSGEYRQGSVTSGPDEHMPVLAPSPTREEQTSRDFGSFPLSSTIEIPIEGPDSRAMSEQSNPFLVNVEVTFSGPAGQSYRIPAFFDGDGSGGLDGNVWKVRFYPDAAGEWAYSTHSSTSLLDAQQGYFQVTAGENCQGEGSSDLRCLGLLEYNGSHYLRFKNGTSWIKGGIDDPENFLGKPFGGWQEKKRVLDYLASRGVNSIYVITNNIDGDGQDTWPWLGSTPEEAKRNNDRFDPAKLAQWEDFFSYAESKGIVLHLVLNDDNAWDGYDPEIYFREMVARFGHHPGLIWNLGEEANEIFSNDEQVRLAKMLKEKDPYKHPVTVHRTQNWPFIGNPNFDLTSMQVGEGADDFSTSNIPELNRIVRKHRESSAAAGRPIPIMVDETAGVDKVNDATRFKLRSQVLYPIYLGGGNFELHFRNSFFVNGLASLKQLEPMFEDMRLARRFVEGLPFARMSSCNGLISTEGAYCFGLAEQVYAVYLPRGGQVRIDLSAMNGAVRASWYNPRSGQTQEGGSFQGGKAVTLSAPSGEDWVLRLNGSGGGACSSNHVLGTETNVELATRAIAQELLAFWIFVPVVSSCN